MRLLEAQMASLRQSYEDWILNDPSDKRSDINDQDPSDEMMEKYELEERQHKEQVSFVTSNLSPVCSFCSLRTTHFHRRQNLVV